MINLFFMLKPMDFSNPVGMKFILKLKSANLTRI